MIQKIILMLALSTASFLASAQVPVVGGPIDVTAMLAQVAQAQSEIDHAKSGTALGAVEATVEFLKLMMAVPGESITADTPVAHDNSITVSAAIPNNICVVTLIKNPLSNKFGWTVQENKCKKL